MNYAEVDLTDFDVTIDDTRFLTMWVPTETVSLDWTPNTREHGVMSGDLLKNGFVVINADSIMRENPAVLTPEYAERNPGWKGPSEYERARVNETSRWAVVTDVKHSGSQVRFTAVYADGSIVPRHYSNEYKWAVLKETQASPHSPHSLKKMLTTGQILNKFDTAFVDMWLRGSRGVHGIPISEDENSAAGETAEKPPVSPTNFERRLRDASSRSEVRTILEERDDYFGKRLADKIVKGETPDYVTVILAKEFILADVLFVAGVPYTVTGLSTLEGFEDEIQVDLNKIGTDRTRSLSFGLNEKVVIAGRS